MLSRWTQSLIMVAIALLLSLVMRITPAHAVSNNATVWNHLEQLLFAQMHYPDAPLAYNHALLINPYYSLVLANRCGVLSQLGEFSQALVSCDLVLEINSQWGEQGSALGWDNRGDALFNLEQYQETLTSFEQALAHNPDYRNARCNGQITLLQLEKMEGYEEGDIAYVGDF